MLESLQELMAGKVAANHEAFFLRSKQGERENSAYWPFRKRGLGWLLIQNDCLWRGAVLFGDQPETKLHLRLRKCVAILAAFTTSLKAERSINRWIAAAC